MKLSHISQRRKVDYLNFSGPLYAAINANISLSVYVKAQQGMINSSNIQIFLTTQCGL